MPLSCGTTTNSVRLLRLFLFLFELQLERPDAHFGCWSLRVEQRDSGRGSKSKSFLQRRRPASLLQKRPTDDEPRSRGTQFSTSVASNSAGSAQEEEAEGVVHATRQPATQVKNVLAPGKLQQGSTIPNPAQLALPESDSTRGGLLELLGAREHGELTAPVHFAGDFCLTEDDFICEQLDTQANFGTTTRPTAQHNWEKSAKPNVFTFFGGSSDADVAALTRDDLALPYSGDRVTLTRTGNDVKREEKVVVRCRTKATFNFANVDAELGVAGEKWLNEQLADKQRVTTAKLKGEKTEITYTMEREGRPTRNPGLVFELDTSHVGEKLGVQAFVMVPRKKKDMKDDGCRLRKTQDYVTDTPFKVPECYSVMLYESNQFDHFKVAQTMLKPVGGLRTVYGSKRRDPQNGHAGNELVEFHMHRDGGFAVKLNRMEVREEVEARNGAASSSSSMLQRRGGASATIGNGGRAAKFHSDGSARRGAVAVPLLVEGKGVETEPERTQTRRAELVFAPTTTSALSRTESNDRNPISTESENNNGGRFHRSQLTSFLQRRTDRHGYQRARAKTSATSSNSKDPVLVVWCGTKWDETCLTPSEHLPRKDEEVDDQMRSLRLVQASSRERYDSEDLKLFRSLSAEALRELVTHKGMQLFVELQTWWVESTRTFDNNGQQKTHVATKDMKMPQEELGDLGKAKLRLGAVRISKHAKVIQVTEEAAGYKQPKTCAELWKARGGRMPAEGTGGQEGTGSPSAARPAAGAGHGRDREWDEEKGSHATGSRRRGRHSASEEGRGSSSSSSSSSGSRRHDHVNGGRKRDRAEQEDHDAGGFSPAYLVLAIGGGAAAAACLCLVVVCCCCSDFCAHDYDGVENSYGIEEGQGVGDRGVSALDSATKTINMSQFEYGGAAPSPKLDQEGIPPSGMGDSELRDTPQPGTNSFILPVAKPKNNKKPSKKEKHYGKKRPRGEGESSSVSDVSDSEND